jgi:hypothetical protein
MVIRQGSPLKGTIGLIAPSTRGHEDHQRELSDVLCSEEFAAAHRMVTRGIHEKSDPVHPAGRRTERPLREPWTPCSLL